MYPVNESPFPWLAYVVAVMVPIAIGLLRRQGGLIVNLILSALTGSTIYMLTEMLVQREFSPLVGVGITFAIPFFLLWGTPSAILVWGMRRQ